MKDLFNAIKEQDFEKVKTLAIPLARQRRLNEPLYIEGKEYSPLIYAISELSLLNDSEGLKIVEVLLKNGADPNFQVIDYYPLDLAVERGNFKLVEMLVSHKAIMHEEVLGNIVLKATDENLENSLKLTEFLIKELIFKYRHNTQLEPSVLVKHILANSWKQSHTIMKPFLELLYHDFILVKRLSKFSPISYQLDEDHLYVYNENYKDINLNDAFEFLIPHYNQAYKDPQLLDNIIKILTTILDLDDNQDLNKPDISRLLEIAREHNYEIFDHSGIIGDSNNQDLFLPLLQACKYGCKDIIELLLKKGADVTVRSKYNDPLVELLSSSNSDFVDSKKFEIVELLLSKGADPNNGVAPTVLSAIISNSSPTVSISDKLKIMTLLLDNDADPNKISQDGLTPLMTLIYKNSNTSSSDKLKMMELLLDKGADPNMHSSASYSPFNTPLTFLISFLNLQTPTSDKLKMMELLLDNGADPNLHYSAGYTPLTALIANSSPTISISDKLDMMKLLLAKGADPDIQDDKGHLPLLQAIENHEFDIVKLLLEQKPNLKDLDAKTLDLLDQADPELLAKSGIRVDNKFKNKVIEQESSILTKLINLINQITLFFEEKLYNRRKFFDEYSVDNSHITVSLVDSVKPSQGESLPNQPDTSLGIPTQNSNEHSK